MRMGILDLIQMRKAGVTVGLGTDAMTVNMLEELRAALWAQHLFQQDASAAFDEVTSTLLQNNATIAGIIWDVPAGAIAEGYAGDVILVDYNPATPFTDETILGHLVYGISQASIDTTIVGGRILMAGKQLKLEIDEREVAAKARGLAESLWERF